MDDEFNPYTRRDVEKPLSSCEAFMTVLKCVIGTGVLTLPMAFKHGGLVGGPLMTILCSFLIVYCMQILVECMVECSRRNQVGYMNLAESMAFALSIGPECCQSLSKCMASGVDVLMCICNYGINVVYLVFVAINLEQMLRYYEIRLDQNLVTLIVGTCLLPLFLVRELKYLVPVVIIANVFIYFGLAATLYYMVRDLPTIEDKRLFPMALDVPMFMAIIMFSASSVGVMLAVESTMAKPERFLGFTGVLSLSALCICLTNIIFGFFGYWQYGAGVADTITLSLPPEEILAQVIKMVIMFAVFFSFPLYGFVPIDIILHHCLARNRPLENPHRAEYILRIVFVTVCTLNAIVFTNFGPLVALVGALTMSTLNLIFPCCMDICLCYDISYGRLMWKLWRDIIIILFGSTVLIYGSFSAIQAMINSYNEEE